MNLFHQLLCTVLTRDMGMAGCPQSERWGTIELFSRDRINSTENPNIANVVKRWEVQAK